MKKTDEIIKSKYLAVKEIGKDGGYGFVWLPGAKKPVMAVFSWGGGWDHVSVSHKNRCCTWEEMCKIKDIFFYEYEWVVQYHPAKEDYVNIHPYVLHLWRPQNETIPIPPKEFV